MDGVKQKHFLIAIIFLLSLLSIYFAFFRNRMAYHEKMEITLQDTNLISEIRIIHDKNEVNITKIEEKWLVNKVYNANEFAIKRLFRIFKNLEINTLLPEDEHDSLISQLEESGISIRFFNNKILKASYIIGNYDENKQSTVLMTDKKLPIYASAPGLASDIRKFVEADPLFWRNKRIFQLEPAEIESIRFFDSKKPENSFQIEIQEDDYQVSDLNQKPIKFDKEKVSRYISYFKNIEFESVAVEPIKEKIDSILKLQGDYLIKVKSINGLESELKLLSIKLMNEPNQYDLNKAYGIINNQQPLVLINYFAVDPIIKDINYFK